MNGQKLSVLFLELEMCAMDIQRRNYLTAK